jgi:hypothetical protein
MGGDASNCSCDAPLGDTWELTAVDKPLINEQPASQYRQPGETATFAVTAVGPGTLAYQWFRNGSPLSDGGRVSGATIPTLTVTSVNTGDAGNYRVRILNACGATTSLPAILTLDLTVQIFSSDNTITLVCGATNVVLEQASSPSGAVDRRPRRDQSVHCAGVSGQPTLPPSSGGPLRTDCGLNYQLSVDDQKLFPRRASLSFDNGAERFRFEVKSVMPAKLTDEDMKLFQPPGGLAEGARQNSSVRPRAPSRRYVRPER